AHVSPVDPFLTNRDKAVHEYGVSRETESTLGPARPAGGGAGGSGVGSPTDQGVPAPRLGSGYVPQASAGQVYGTPTPQPEPDEPRKPAPAPRSAPPAVASSPVPISSPPVSSAPTPR